MKRPPPSLKLYALLKEHPGALGGRSILDEHGQLWAEFDQYVSEIAEARAEREALRRARGR